MWSIILFGYAFATNQSNTEVITAIIASTKSAAMATRAAMMQCFLEHRDTFIMASIDHGGQTRV